MKTTTFRAIILSLIFGVSLNSIERIVKAEPQKTETSSCKKLDLIKTKDLIWTFNYPRLVYPSPKPSLVIVLQGDAKNSGDSSNLTVRQKIPTTELYSKDSDIRLIASYLPNLISQGYELPDFLNRSYKRLIY